MNNTIHIHSLVAYTLTQDQVHEVSVWCWDEILAGLWDRENEHTPVVSAAIEAKKKWVRGEVTSRTLKKHRNKLIEIIESQKCPWPDQGVLIGVAGLISNDRNDIAESVSRVVPSVIAVNAAINADGQSRASEMQQARATAENEILNHIEGQNE